MTAQLALNVPVNCNAQGSELAARVRFPEILYYMQLFLLGLNMLGNLPIDAFF